LKSALRIDRKSAAFWHSTPAAMARLKPALAPLNVEKTVAAPVTVIIAWDTEFHEKLPERFPHADMRSYSVGNKPLIDETAFLNSSLQAAYFIWPHAPWAWIADRCPASTQTQIPVPGGGS
jgi:hypothetical protein